MPLPTQREMSTKHANTQPAPPAAYAAFVRIYIEWMEKEENERIDLVENRVLFTQKRKTGYTSISPLNGPFGKRGSTLFGVEFDEYVNEVWADFLEKFQNVDGFADYLQKDFYKKVTKQNKFILEMKEKFDEIEDAINNMSDDEVDQYLEEKEKELLTEIVKRRNEWDIIYPSMERILGRLADSKMNREYTAYKKQRKTVHNDAEDEYKTPPAIANTKSNKFPIMDEDEAQKILDQTKVALSDEDKQIMRLKIRRYKNKDIAEELGMSESKVSRHISAIKTKLENIAG